MRFLTWRFFIHWRKREIIKHRFEFSLRHCISVLRRKLGKETLRLLVRLSLREFFRRWENLIASCYEKDVLQRCHGLWRNSQKKIKLHGMSSRNWYSAYSYSLHKRTSEATFYWSDIWTLPSILLKLILA